MISMWENNRMWENGSKTGSVATMHKAGIDDPFGLEVVEKLKHLHEHVPGLFGWCDISFMERDGKMYLLEFMLRMGHSNTCTIMRQMKTPYMDFINALRRKDADFKMEWHSKFSCGIDLHGVPVESGFTDSWIRIDQIVNEAKEKFFPPDVYFDYNTSGLSINALADALPAALRPNFCGIHFFNPPRYMPLVEIIATRSTAAATLDGLETWLTSRLGKGVVRALDTPNFVANRIGVFSILSVMHHTQAFALGLDTVDALTGPKVGRPKSATYRTGDVVGLDTLAHVVKTMQDTLPDDPWHAHFSMPTCGKRAVSTNRPQRPFTTIFLSRLWNCFPRA
jgi:hypothetical protein